MRCLRVPAAVVLVITTFAACGTAPVGPITGATPCGGSTAWPPVGYPATLPSGVDVVAEGLLGARVTNSTDDTIHVRVATWGLGTCTGWLTFTPDQAADIPARLSRDFELTDPSSGTPFRLGVEVWSAACPDACTGSPSGFWSGSLIETSPLP